MPTGDHERKVWIMTKNILADGCSEPSISDHPAHLHRFFRVAAGGVDVNSDARRGRHPV